MKNFLCLLIAFILSFQLFAQLPLQAVQHDESKEIIFDIESPVHQYQQPSNTKSWISRWYNYGETMEAFLGVTSPLYGNFLFPDSTILVNYTSGYGSPWIHKVADVLDVTSVMFNNPQLHPNALTIDASTKYRLDSIHFHCKYSRNINLTNVVDTLLFEISVNDNLLPSFFAPGILSPNLSTDTVFMKRIPYAFQTNTLNLANKKIIKVPLTTQIHADSSFAGLHIIKVGTDSIPVINPGKQVAVAVTFIPGYTWIANTDIIDNKNSILFLSKKERDNFFPHYTKKDFNISYILPSDVRYNYAGSWNANFIPSFAYMGTTPTYNYEHHMIYYKISTAFKITYESQNVSCFGGNNGKVDLTISGGTPPYNFAWSHGASTQNVSNLSAGVYNVTITDQAQDTTIRTFTITQPPLLTANFSSTPATACGVSDGAVEITNIQGGTPGYSIIVLDADSVTQTMSDLMAGIYTVKVIDIKGCKVISHVPVNETGAPSYTVNQNNISCHGLTDGTISINVSNATGTPVYSWSNAQTGNSLTNLASGNYLLTVTDNNCHIYESFTITEPTPINVNGTVQNATGGQSNGTIILQVSGGTPPYAYSWSSGQHTQNLGSLSQGTYTVTVTDAKQCTHVSTFTVTSTGIDSDNINASVHIYPNPVNNTLNLNIEGHNNKYAEVYIYGAQGQLLKSEKIFVQNNVNYTIDLFNFTQGLFFIEIIIDGQKMYKKIIKN